MPNWSNNQIEISGSEENMKPIYDFFSKHEDKEHRGDQVMNTLIPHDDEYRRIVENNEFLLHAQTTFYGTKWDFSLADAYVNDCTPTYVHLSPATAWTPPIEFCSKLCKKYGVEVKIMYSEPGSNFAGYADIDTDGFVDDYEFPYLEGIYRYFDEEEFWNEIEFEIESEMDNDDPKSVEDFLKKFPYVSDEDKMEISSKYLQSLNERV